jgi:hypothetical protein
LPKFFQDNCEVCHEPIIDTKRLPPEIQEKVYRPGNDEEYNVEVDLTPPVSFSGGASHEIEVSVPADE